MRILFITPKFNLKNISGSIVEYDIMIRDLMKLGHQVTIVTTFSDLNDGLGETPYKVIEENIDRPRKLLKIQRAVFRIFKKYSDQADFFHVDGQVFLYGAGLYRMLGGKVPVSAYFNRELVCWPDGEANFLLQNSSFLVKLKKTFRFYIEKYIGTPLASRIDLMLFTNPHLRRSYEEFGLKTNDNRVLIFGDSVDVQKNMNDHGVTEDYYVKRNKINEKLNVFYSSRMVPGKGFELLITAFSKIINKERYNLILGGTGPQELEIKKMVKELGLEPHVIFPGWVAREEIFNSYKRADIFVQPRWRRDLTSMSLMDAMTFGVPIIAPGGGGLEWDAKNGALYFKDGNADDLARKIEELGDNRDLRAKLSKACYARLADNEMKHDWQAEQWSNKMKEIKVSQDI